MKMDMHCHTKEGSIDGKVSLEEYIELLEEKGFGGMLITDHNSYKGYRHWRDNIKGKSHTDFVVLKGIEYDTSNAGHILVIMPEGMKLRILELRGMPVSLLITFVHAFGGILGPAHPCGEKYMSLANTRYYRKNRSVLAKFDFIEGFNACEPEEANKAAMKLAERYKKPVFGGSDSHRPDCVGTGFTDFKEEITCESQLIEYVRQKKPMEAGGELYKGTTKEKIGAVNNVLVYSFWLYNKSAAFLRAHKRRGQSRYLKLNMDNVNGKN